MIALAVWPCALSKEPPIDSHRKYKVLVLVRWAVAASRVGKGLVSLDREDRFNKVTLKIPVLKRDLDRINVGGLAWERAHKDSVRAALAPSRGAS
eukprot:1150139-Pelagomonas_calceolata.AAC.2